jgi:cytochrome c oxidase subunit 2
METGPENAQFGFQPAGSEIAARIGEFHQHLMWIGGGVALAVLLLLAFVCVRFRESRHPEPWRITRAPLIEFGWTVLPVLILGAIASPSLKLLAYETAIPNSNMTVKIGAHQWFWRYEYPDNGGISFDSTMLPPNSLEPGQKRLLEVDNRLIVPAGRTIRIQTTSSDVVHSFFVPSLGVQIYAIPGRLNETWVRIDRPGVYFGQCNQICGLNHSFMPIAIEAVSQEKFDAWLKQASTQFSQVARSDP